MKAFKVGNTQKMKDLLEYGPTRYNQKYNLVENDVFIVENEETFTKACDEMDISCEEVTEEVGKQISDILKNNGKPVQTEPEDKLATAIDNAAKKDPNLKRELENVTETIKPKNYDKLLEAYSLFKMMRKDLGVSKKSALKESAGCVGVKASELFKYIQKKS